MIVRNAIRTSRLQNAKTTSMTLQELSDGFSTETMSGEIVTPQRSQTIATAYRAANIIGDDFAKLPFQQFERINRSVQQVRPDARLKNLAYRLEVSPNEWGWTPFQFKKAIIDWQIWHGNAIVWRPPMWPQQLLILPANRTRPMFDENGYLWYEHRFSNNETKYIPSVEILHVLINPDETGFWGRGVITFAKETFGRQLGAHKVQAKNFSRGLKSHSYVQVASKLDKDDRDRIRTSYEEALETYGLAVFDSAIVKFEPIQMKNTDAQFLEQINATKEDIANFFGMPLHMLNMGKQAYNSNDQKFGEYLQGTLDAYLVPFEQAARIRWLTEEEQGNQYFKFIREALLRMDAKTRAETNEIKIRSGQMAPNEAREKDDESAYAEGDKFYMTSNYAPIGGSNNA